MSGKLQVLCILGPPALRARCLPALLLCFLPVIVAISARALSYGLHARRHAPRLVRASLEVCRGSRREVRVDWLPGAPGESLAQDYAAMARAVTCGFSEIADEYKALDVNLRPCRARRLAMREMPAPPATGLSDPA